MPAQTDVDALLTTAEAAVAGTAPAASGAKAAEVSGPPRSKPAPSPATSDPLRRILKLSVPIIVRLAVRPMAISEIMRWGRGTIVEFGKPADARLDLLVNDRCIGD